MSYILTGGIIGRIYEIFYQIGDVDTILRVDQVYAVQKGEYIIFKNPIIN